MLSSSQERIDHGVLIRWTKGFGAPNTEGRDVAAMFRKSIEKRVSITQFYGPSTPILIATPKKNLPINLTALINDTTGTLIASHYVNPKTKIAVIFGTGCNAAYMENIADIEKINQIGLDPKDDMAINCEWVSRVFFSEVGQ